MLIYSAEKLITYLVGAARGLAVSLFLLAILFTGIEFDNLVSGVVLNLGAGGRRPRRHRPDRHLDERARPGAGRANRAVRGGDLEDHIVIFALAPLVLVVPAPAGELNVLTSNLFILLFVVFVAHVAYRESAADPHGPQRRGARADGGA